MTDTGRIGVLREHWAALLREYLSGFLEGHEALSQVHRRASILLHGSTTMGVDDPHADIDLWMLLSEEDLALYDSLAPTRFVQFKIEGKEGHINPDSAVGVARRLERCDMDLIYQLRSAEILTDNTGEAARLQAVARHAMSKAVSRALFFYHYVEMRGEHRSCDNPIERGHATALLLALGKTVTHALQAAIVLDGQPYPYDKWLYHAALATPTGQKVAPAVDRIIELLGSGVLCAAGPQKDHPLCKELMTIRHTLIAAAQEAGYDDQWLGAWYLHMDQACEAFENVRWSDDD